MAYNFFKIIPNYTVVKLLNIKMNKIFSKETIKRMFHNVSVCAFAYTCMRESEFFYVLLCVFVCMCVCICVCVLVAF